MGELKNLTDLLHSINRLEKIKLDQGMILRTQVGNGYQRMKPINLLRNMLKEASESINIHNTIISSGLSLATGYVFNKILPGKKTSRPKKIIGSMMVMLLTNFISNNAENIKNLGSSLLGYLKAKNEAKNKNLI